MKEYAGCYAAWIDRLGRTKHFLELERHQVQVNNSYIKGTITYGHRVSQLARLGN
jgi:hypothetical protein